MRANVDVSLELARPAVSHVGAGAPLACADSQRRPCRQNRSLTRTARIAKSAAGGFRTACHVGVTTGDLAGLCQCQAPRGITRAGLSKDPLVEYGLKCQTFR